MNIYRYIYSILELMGLFMLRSPPQLGMQCHDSAMRLRKPGWKLLLFVEGVHLSNSILALFY